MMTQLIPSQRILLVDDEPMVRNTIEMLLTMDHHQVDAVSSGAHALEKLEKHNYDFVFTDHIMPGMTGEELARAIKAKYPNQMIVMLTGYGDVLDELTQEAPIVNFCIRKPVDMPFLRLMLTSLISKRNA